MTSADRDVRVIRESHGPFTRFIMSAPVDVPGEGFMATAEVSAYLAGDVLIDAGCSRFASSLVDALAGSRPQRIVLTHQHEDHVGAVSALRRAFGHMPVFAPRPLLPLLATGEQVSSYRVAYWGQPDPIVDAIAIDEGDLIDAGTVTLRAIATPGHTPGHMSYLTTGGGPVYGLTGDLLINSRMWLGFFESSAQDLVDSLRLVADIGAPLYILPAHGRARAEGAAVLLKAAEWIENEATMIRKAATDLGSLDPVKVARHLYGPPEPAELATGGDFSTAALVRSVLAPPRTHPVARLNLTSVP